MLCCAKGLWALSQNWPRFQIYFDHWEMHHLGIGGGSQQR